MSESGDMLSSLGTYIAENPEVAIRLGAAGAKAMGAPAAVSAVGDVAAGGTEMYLRQGREQEYLDALKRQKFAESDPEGSGLSKVENATLARGAPKSYADTAGRTVEAVNRDREAMQAERARFGGRGMAPLPPFGGPPPMIPGHGSPPPMNQAEYAKPSATALIARMIAERKMKDQFNVTPPGGGPSFG